MPSPTLAGLLASLYADPEDSNFLASKVTPPTLEHLGEAYQQALDLDLADAASAYAAEICRSLGLSRRDTSLSSVPGNRNGIWRLQ